MILIHVLQEPHRFFFSISINTFLCLVPFYNDKFAGFVTV